MLVIALCVLAAILLVLEQRRHIAMTAYSDTLAARTAYVLHKAINLSGIVFCALLTLRYILEFCGVQDRFDIKNVIADH